MRIQRYCFLLVSSMLLFGLVGCSSGDSNPGESAETVESVDNVESAAAQTESGSGEAADETESAEPTYPRPIIGVLPKPGEAICQPYSLNVRFKLNASMVMNGQYDEAAFDLYLDGRNIKREVEFFPSQVFPHTHVALLHGMWVYDPGEHTARVEFIGDDGDTEYEWRFTVKEDCPKRNF